MYKYYKDLEKFAKKSNLTKEESFYRDFALDIENLIKKSEKN